MNESPTYAVPRCCQLRSKAMLVYGEDFEHDPDYQPGLTDFWCLATAKAQGPDGGFVDLAACSDAKRECYRGY
jgi:hypothetical protein